jgi:hypothetical protein
LTTAIRDRHFEFARQAVADARDQAAAARQVVLLITLAALGIAVAVATKPWRSGVAKSFGVSTLRCTTETVRRSRGGPAALAVRATPQEGAPRHFRRYRHQQR